MKFTINPLIKITLGCFIAMALVWGTLYFHGVSRRYVPFDHPLLKEQGPHVISYGGDTSKGPSHSLEAISASFSEGKNWLAIDIYLSGDRSFYVIPSSIKEDWQKRKDYEIDSLDAGAFFSGPNGDYPFKEKGYKFLKLEQLVNEFPNQKYFLWIRDNTKDIDLILAAFFKKHLSLQNQVLLHSEYDNVVHSLKEQLPRWAYGVGSGEKTRFMMFDAIGLQGAANLLGDFYFTSLRSSKVKMISLSMVQELAKRGIPLFVGPVDSEEEEREAKSLQIKTIITPRASEFSP